MYVSLGMYVCGNAQSVAKRGRWEFSNLGGGGLTVTSSRHLLDISVGALSFAYQALLVQGGCI